LSSIWIRARLLEVDFTKQPMNVERGSRRAAWVLIILSIPVIGYLTFARSGKLDGYQLRRLTSGFPNPDETSNQIEIEIKGLGFAYFPSSIPPDDVAQERRILSSPQSSAQYVPDKSLRSVSDFATALRSKYPEDHPTDDDLELVRRALFKYPVYRLQVDFREFNVEPVVRKRPYWAAVMTLVLTLALAAFLQGSVSALKWIAKGFRSTPSS